MRFEIDLFPCRADNYGVLVHDPAGGSTLSIDAPDAAAIESRLAARGWQLTEIFVTHHHGDHTAGNLDLRAAHGCRIAAPAAERDRIPGVDLGVAEGGALAFAGAPVTVLATPGHTLGHVAYHFADEGLLFAGDTLFALGCGRPFEAPPAVLWESLRKLRALPRETVVYCGHEYAATNARFALTLEPANLDLVVRAGEIAALRAGGRPAMPTTIGEELRTNPFLRADNRRLKRAVGMADADPADVFAEIRARRSAFA